MLGGYLQVIRGFELPVFHGIVFHARKGGIGVGFGATVSIAAFGELLFVFFELGQVLVLDVADLLLLGPGPVLAVDLSYPHQQFFGLYGRRWFIVGRIVLVDWPKSIAPRDHLVFS
jgi:hypothetical protein